LSAGCFDKVFMQRQMYRILITIINTNDDKIEIKAIVILSRPPSEMMPVKEIF